MSKSVTRRVLLGSAFAAGLLASGGAAAQDLKTVRVGILPIIEFTPVSIAMEKGFFAEEGIDVVTQASGGGAASIPGLIGGSFDIVQGNPVSTILALNEGLPLTIVGIAQHMASNPAPTQMVARAGVSFDTGADFDGKSIGVNTRNNIIWLYAAAWAESRGADLDKVNFREINFPQMEDALRQGNVDVAFMVEPFKSAAVADGSLVIAADVFSEVQPGANVGHYLTTQDYAAANPELVEAFLRGVRRGAAWYNENRGNPEGLQAVSSLTRLPVETLEKIDLPELPTVLSIEQHVETAELMKKLGMISDIPDIAAHVHPAALSE